MARIRLLCIAHCCCYRLFEFLSSRDWAHSASGGFFIVTAVGCFLSLFTEVLSKRG